MRMSLFECLGLCTDTQGGLFKWILSFDPSMSLEAMLTEQAREQEFIARSRLLHIVLINNCKTSCKHAVLIHQAGSGGCLSCAES